MEKTVGKLVSFTPDFSNSLRRLILSSIRPNQQVFYLTEVLKTSTRNSEIIRKMKEVPANLQQRSGRDLRWLPDHHSPVLVAYCRLPRFLKGDRGLLLAPDVVPVGTLVDMLPGSAQ